MIFLQGFTLLEVLISLLLFSLILLGFEDMQIVALKNARAANYFYLATEQMHNITERLKLLSNQHGLHQQIIQWNNENQQVLPAGRGLSVGQYPHYTLTLYWGNFNKKCDTIYLGQAGCIANNLYL